MSLICLDMTNFRNFVSSQFKPLSAGFNLIYGHNGSGKTSLLEAIYYLSLGRSFRSTLIGRTIHQAADRFLLFAQTALQDTQIVPIGIERQLVGDMKIRIAGKDANSVAELAELMPVQLINSHCYNLLDGGPVFRRKYLDWGVFYLNKDFLRLWKDTSQLIKQRNALLRRYRPQKELEIWNKELASKALLLNQYRQEYVQRLLPLLLTTVAELLPSLDVNITYRPGWDETKDYGDVLTASLERDIQLGHTQFGPHRADLKITINKVIAKDILSRGQQKLFVCAMILAQGTLLNSDANKKPIYLIDDLPAELDIVSRTNLIALLSKQETQIFITAVERGSLSECLSALPLKMFHVEHGEITEVM
jgi:DNA replication and repair protein RecF